MIAPSLFRSMRLFEYLYFKQGAAKQGENVYHKGSGVASSWLD